MSRVPTRSDNKPSGTVFMPTFAGGASQPIRLVSPANSLAEQRSVVDEDDEPTTGRNQQPPQQGFTKETSPPDVSSSLNGDNSQIMMAALGTPEETPSSENGNKNTKATTKITNDDDRILHAAALALAEIATTFGLEPEKEVQQYNLRGRRKKYHQDYNNATTTVLQRSSTTSSAPRTPIPTPGLPFFTAIADHPSDILLADSGIQLQTKAVPECRDIQKLQETDILLGSSYSRNRHNAHYQNLLKAYKPIFETYSKEQKDRLGRNLLAYIRASGGRFLELQQDNVWCEIGDERALPRLKEGLRQQTKNHRKNKSNKKNSNNDNKTTMALPAVPQPKRELDHHTDHQRSPFYQRIPHHPSSVLLTDVSWNMKVVKEDRHTPIIDIQPADVMLGRQSAGHRHNNSYQQLLNAYRPLYQSFEEGQNRKLLSKNVLCYIRSCGGRFLEKNNGTWFEIGDEKVLAKLRRSLRYKAAGS